jgi:allantoinase
MYFAAEQIKDGETTLKSIPPIRDLREKELILKIFRKKYYSVLSSNHFPVHPKYKNNVNENFFKALSGISSIGMTLSVVWTVFN